MPFMIVQCQMPNNMIVRKFVLNKTADACALTPESKRTQIEMFWSSEIALSVDPSGGEWLSCKIQNERLLALPTLPNPSITVAESPATHFLHICVPTFLLNTSYRNLGPCRSMHNASQYSASFSTAKSGERERDGVPTHLPGHAKTRIFYYCLVPAYEFPAFCIIFRYGQGESLHSSRRKMGKDEPLSGRFHMWNTCGLWTRSNAPNYNRLFFGQFDLSLLDKILFSERKLALGFTGLAYGANFFRIACKGKYRCVIYLFN